MDRIQTPTMVQADIEGYKAIAIDKETGKIPYIGSRKQHREFLARNGYIEVGNEPVKTTSRKEQTSDITYDLGDL